MVFSRKSLPTCPQMIWHCGNQCNVSPPMAGHFMRAICMSILGRWFTTLPFRRSVSAVNNVNSCWSNQNLKSNQPSLFYTGLTNIKVKVTDFTSECIQSKLALKFWKSPPKLQLPISRHNKFPNEPTSTNAQLGGRPTPDSPHDPKSPLGFVDPCAGSFWSDDFYHQWLCKKKTWQDPIRRTVLFFFFKLFCVCWFFCCWLLFVVVFCCWLLFVVCCCLLFFVVGSWAFFVVDCLWTWRMKKKTPDWR